MHDTGNRTARTRVFLDSEAVVGRRVELPVDEAYHIFKVLRARDGDFIEIVTPGRSLMLAEVYGDARHAEAGVLEELSNPGDQQDQQVRVALYQAVPKGKHMDLVVEKATELGVERIVPLLTDHGEVKPETEKTARWRRIAGAAARQSLQLRVPEILEPLQLGEALKELREAGEPGVVLHNEPGLRTLEEATPRGGSVALLVGPEGGWSDEELILARDSGFGAAQMGPYRLRAETAGIVAVARAEARLRDIQRPDA
jgi:16S rRNA (uracil1498-N3)-methyltransferase